MKTVIKYMFILLFVLPILSVAQTNYYSGKIRVIVHDSQIVPLNGGESSDSIFNQVLSDFDVLTITQPLSFAKTPELQRLYELNTSHDEDSLFDALTNINSNSELFLSVERVPIPQPISAPADYMWQLMLDNDSTNDWLWYLSKIDAPKAWSITKGDTNVIVAVTDDGIDMLHPDLVGKVFPLNNFFTGTPFSVGLGHGTSVTTILAAETVDSGQTANGQMASIGYNTRIMFNAWSTDACLYASTNLNADIITLSWYFSCTPLITLNHSDLLIEQEILNNGTTIIRAAGNGSIHCNGQRLYPFSGLEDPRTIVISSTGKDDKHVNSEFCSNNSTNSHYPEVDLCAPGYNLIGGTLTNNGQSSWPYYGCWGGTSQSTPIVSGTAALMYSVNPCLNSNWVQDILKNTTDPIVDAVNFPGVIGSGRLNAGNAVEAAQGAYSADLDLYIKDRLEDFGYPGSYAWGWWFDKSPDIWVRNQADGFTNFTHEEPEYSSSQPVYVYVRVWNKSCDSSNAVGDLSLYWTKASSASSWPQNWDGTQPTTGDKIGTISIPNLGPGESKIFEFQWTILNPYVHSNWASCLLARIEGISNDAITVYPNHLEKDVFNNNNIALRNVTIVDINPFKQLPVINGLEYPHGRFMYVGNATNTSNNFDITFEVATDEGSASLIEEAEVHIYTDQAGWAIIGNAVTQHPDLEVVGDKEFIITNSDVTLQNISFNANTRIPLYVGFSFLIDEITTEETYHYRVAQRYAGQENDITGAEHFTIRKSPRASFSADAGWDKQIKKNDSTTVNATDITEPAIYNWYDPDGNLIYTGKDAMVSPEITTTYKLEVVANTDGFKDYDEVVVEVQQYWIDDVAPNPTTTSTNVTYQIDGASSTYLMVLNGFGTVSNNYILSPNSNQINVNVSGYTSGSYNIILIVDGQAADAKTLIIQ